MIGAVGASCPICLVRPADTKEDVLPQWARRRMARLGEYVGGQHPSILLRICSNCNGTLSRTFEAPAAPILGPMVSGEDQDLDLNAQLTITRWFVKSLLVHNIKVQGTSPTNRTLLRFLTNDSGLPFPAYLRIGRLAPTSGAGHSEDLRPTGPFLVPFLATVNTTGHLVADLAIGHPMPPFVDSQVGIASLIQVSPPMHPLVAWPPPRPVTISDVNRLRASWVAGCWPPLQGTPAIPPGAVLSQSEFVHPATEEG